MNSTKHLSCQILAEFLEIAIHNVLQIRKIYPDAIFIKKQKYGTIVYQTIHPQLKDYISNCIEAVYNLTKEGYFSKLIISFIQLENVAEKIVFDVSPLKDLFDKDPFLLEIERIFRAFFIRLHTLNEYVDPLPENTTFRVEIHTSESTAVDYMENPKYQNFPWVQINSSKSDINTSEIVVPIETINTDIINMQIYMERNS